MEEGQTTEPKGYCQKPLQLKIDSLLLDSELGRKPLAPEGQQDSSLPPSNLTEVITKRSNKI
jgi:hypothetical protein